MGTKLLQEGWAAHKVGRLLKRVLWRTLGGALPDIFSLPGGILDGLEGTAHEISRPDGGQKALDSAMGGNRWGRDKRVEGCKLGRLMNGTEA